MLTFDSLHEASSEHIMAAFSAAWRSSITLNSSLLIGFIICIFASKDENNHRMLKRVVYRGLTLFSFVNLLVVYYTRKFV